MKFTWANFCLAFLLCGCIGQQIGNIIYITRWHSIDVCDRNTPVTVNGSSTLYQTMEVWNGVVNVSKDLLLEKVIIIMQKCSEGFFACEKYITIKLDKNLKEFLLAKDKGWASLWGAVQPQPKLPFIHKGLYTISNATLDVSLMAAFIPELVDHTWKISSTIFNKNDIQQGCAEIQFYIVKYTLRDRKRKRKN